jgi:superfamily II DNA or RNA helicase
MSLQMHSSLVTIISHTGYAVQKSTMETSSLLAMKQELIVSPQTHPDYPVVKSFPVYVEGKQWIRVPRWYGLTKFGAPLKNHLLDFPLDESKCVFSGQLRDSQIIPHDSFLSALLDKQSGLFCMMTGSGKTVTMLSIVSRLKQRTCILIHKSQLLQQWYSEIKRFLPQLSIGIIQQQQKDFSQGCDIYLVMIQTLLNIPRVLQMFGLTVIDECHHIPSCTFSKVLFKVTAKYVVGLTATPVRKDGLTHVLHWHIGDILYQEKPDRRAQKTTHVEVYHYCPPNRIDPRKYAEMISKLCNDKDRSQYILNAIRRHVDQDICNKRRLLILTERKHHAKFIHSCLENIYHRQKTCGLLLGGMKKEILETEMEKELLVATYNLMSEGISIAQLNGILFASPKRDITQALGRIFRKTHTDIHPLVIDIADSMLKGQLKNRLATYAKELNNNIIVAHHHQSLFDDTDNGSQEDVQLSRRFHSILFDSDN